MISLRNLGPKSEAMLGRAGISTLQQLRTLGSVRAYLKVRRSGSEPSLNLLWALEGALTNRPWQEVAKNDRLSLLLQLEQEESSLLRSNSRSNGRAASAAASSRVLAARRSPRR
jgi:DNA transformation protein